MEAKIFVIGGKASKSVVSVQIPCCIGRSREADLTLAHPMVSRQHCELIESEGHLVLRDLGSLNGTFVGGERVHECVLKPSDEFSIGPLTFRAEVASDVVGDAVPMTADATIAVSRSDLAGELGDSALGSSEAKTTPREGEIAGEGEMPLSAKTPLPSGVFDPADPSASGCQSPAPGGSGELSSTADFTAMLGEEAAHCPPEAVPFVGISTPEDDQRCPEGDAAVPPDAPNALAPEDRGDSEPPKA